MAAWPSNPDWTDLSNINKGNEYVGGDGIYYSDLNAIVKNLLVIKKQLDMLSYSIDITATHCVPDPQNPTKITFAGTSTLKFTAETGYTLPSMVNITGATSTWTISNGVGTLTLKDPTSNITGSIVATIITTWLLNSAISAPSNSIDENINFVCVGTSQNFIRILIHSEGKGVHLEYFAQGDSPTSGTNVVTGGVDVATEYRTLTFETSPSGDLLTWLQANATKQ